MHTAFFIRTNGKFQAIPFDSVLFITAKGNYCEITTATKKKFISYGTIGCIEQQLPASLFCRVHRSYIVAIQKVESFDNRHVCLNDEKLPLNKVGFEKILNRVLLVGAETGNKASPKMDYIVLPEYENDSRKLVKEAV